VKFKIVGLFVGISIIGAWVFSLQVRDRTYQILFDLSHANRYVESKDAIDSILNTMKTVSIQKLPSHYREASGIEWPNYRKVYHKAHFYVLNRTELYQRIVGRFSIKDFLPKDETYRQATSVRIARA